MKNSAEPVQSAYIQVDDSLWIRDWIADGSQRRRLVQGLMRPVLVVEPFVLAQGVPKMSLSIRGSDRGVHGGMTAPTAP